MAKSKFGKFLGKLAGDFRNISGVLSLALPALGVNGQDREKMEDGLKALLSAADNIEKSLSRIDEAPKPTKAELEAAVKAVLPGMIAAALKEAGVSKESGGK